MSDDLEEPDEPLARVRFWRKRAVDTQIALQCTETALQRAETEVNSWKRKAEDYKADTRAAVAAERAKRLQLAVLARAVMMDLEEFGPSIVPHLIDSDDNDGQYLRDAIYEILGNDVQSVLEHALMRPENFTIERAADLDAAIRARERE